jgi:hypothetical protein
MRIWMIWKIRKVILLNHACEKERKKEQAFNIFQDELVKYEMR